MKDSSPFKSPFFREAKTVLTKHWRRHSRTKSDAGNFPLFIQLPTEIRLQIWRYHEPRVIELIGDGAGHWRSPQRPPDILSVCRESREEAQKDYHLLRLADSKTCPCRDNYTYIDFSMDTIYMGNGCPDPSSLVALLRKQEQLQKNLVRLALQHRLWSHLAMVGRVGAIHYLEVVEEVIVLCEGVEPPGRRPTQIGFKNPPHTFHYELSTVEESRVKAEGWTFPVIKSHGITRKRTTVRNRVSRSLVDQQHPC